MKKVLLLAVAVIFSFPGLTASPARNANELVWCGIDYTLVKFIGSQDQFSDIPKIQTYYFRAWNELIQAESGKYDLNKAFSVSTVNYHMENSIIRSEGRDMTGILQLEDYTIDEEQVKSVVSQNVDPAMDKLGAMFVMETLNKIQGVSTMWLAVFNVASGEVRYMRRYSGKVGGFGFRNYYARSHYNVIKNLQMAPRSPQE